MKILDDCDADCRNFMEYFSACSEAYADDANFKALMTALTASEDFSTFQHVMILARRIQLRFPYCLFSLCGLNS